MADEKRGGAFNIKGFDTQNGRCDINSGNSGKESTIRGGSGTGQLESESPAGGGLSESGVKNGYPSNK